MRYLFVLVGLVAVLLAGCAVDDRSSESGSGSEGSATSTPSVAAPGEQRYPDVVDVTVERSEGTDSFTVTISSPYDSPERYADGWRIPGPDGTVYGEHTLASSRSPVLRPE